MNKNNNNKKKIIIILICVFLLSGCTKQLKDEDKNVVTNKSTGQSITENIICKPKNKDVIKIYEENNVKISKLPDCDNFNPLTNYEGLWTSIFVKPLAWVILKIGKLLNSYGASIIITCLLIRLILMPVTKKTAIQSELIKKAQPELEKLEKKYKGKESQEDQAKKAQEMMMIYQKYKINPLSGCLLSFIQLPLLFAFLESINRTPALFENNFLVFQMGTTPWVGIFQNHNYWYILLIILIIGTTFISFRKTLKDQSGPTATQMKYTIYFMLAMISVASLTLPAALGIYWITSSLFTILQNLYVERKK
ncbi:MAG: YidC/Oxa1 family membrane protein insertase [Erysipelotrichaceae bacterium]|nr:YidC/Oxa1 family membrane protein insertase [Erysipelotrichaceae bacterium]